MLKENQTQAQWLQLDESGLGFEDLWKIHESMRDQRNKHRESIINYLRFFISISTGILTLIVAVSAIGGRLILDGNPLSGTDLTLISLFILLPFFSTLAFYRLHKGAKETALKEYRKLIEHLTVEQKIESILGFSSKIKISSTIKFDPKDLPYPEDKSFVFPRWVSGRKQDKKSWLFLDNVKNQKDVFFAPLSKTLDIILYFNMFFCIFALVAAMALYISETRIPEMDQERAKQEIIAEPKQPSVTE